MKDNKQGAAVASEADWSLGVDSYTHFSRIGKGYYCWGFNVVNRGGMLQTRPGKSLIFTLPMAGIPQGIKLFRPTQSFGMECIVWAMGGNIYMSRYPFTTYQLVTGLTFYDKAPMVTFCAGIKVSSLNPDGSLTIVSQPYNVLIIQDGYTAAGVFDGAGPHGYHIYGGAPGYGTPMGLHMAWSGNRLWVARENQVFASDYLDPLTFSDSTYLATADNFQLPYECTGMIETPDERTLLAFCDQAVVSFQSQIADRTMWQNVTDFQKIIVPNTGALAPRSIFNQYGTTWFVSEFGLTNINMASATNVTDRLPPLDIEMIRSKDNLSSDQTKICGGTFENFAFLGVPAGSLKNRHTWIIDAAPQSRLGQQGAQNAIASWAGAWTGTYPIEFTTGIVQDAKRCFELAYSCTQKDGSSVHIWENFMGQRWDYNQTPISCMVELRCFDFGTDYYRFRYAEVDLAEIWGEVHFEIWYAGIKGQYYPIGSKTIEAKIGIFTPELEIVYNNDPLTDTMLRSYRPQTRTIRSEEISGSPSEAPDGNLCSVESVYGTNIDKGFQIMLRWTGVCGVRQVRIYAEPYFEPGIGTCEPDETGQTNVLEEIGYLPNPPICAPPIPVAVISPLYQLLTTGSPQIAGQYELYWLASGTPQAPAVVTKLATWVLGQDVIDGLAIDYSSYVTQQHGTQTFLWIFRYLSGTATSPVIKTTSVTPIGNIATGVANTFSLLGLNTFYFTVSDCQHTQYKATDTSTPQPVVSGKYLVDTTHYRTDTYANVNDPANYHGVISYPSLGLELWQLLTTYDPGTHNVTSQTQSLRAVYWEGSGFTIGVVLDITGALDLTQFPLVLTILRKGEAPVGKQTDAWAYAGAGNMQIGITDATDLTQVSHVVPPASDQLPGIWPIIGKPGLMFNSVQVTNPTLNEVELALSPAGAQATMVGFYWPGWDYGIGPTDAFFAGPSGIEIWDNANNVLQRFTYQTDFGPDGNKAVQQYLDLTALCKLHTQIKLVRFSYFGGATKQVYVDQSATAAPFELGEATIIGARYPTDAIITSVNTGAGTNNHQIGLTTAVTGSYNFMFVVINISNQTRYA